MATDIRGATAVITGGSSGIGRATAVAMAARGANVVLAARAKGPLDDAARECEAAGGSAIAVPTDVTDESAVEELARRAYGEFGRIDVWINGAAVMAYGEFESIPAEVYRRVLDTNLFGQLHGVRAVLPYFREQGAGVLINIASVWGYVTSPYVSPYVISKFGVRALSECLNQALAADPSARHIRVCTILPQSVDTPIFRHAANYLGRQVKPVPPILDPDRVSRAILRAVGRPRPRVSVGWWGRFLQLGYTVAPIVFRRIVPFAMRFTAVGSAPAAPGAGNVLEPQPEWNRVGGQWRRRPAALSREV